VNAAAMPLPLFPAYLIRAAKLLLGLLGALWACLLIGAYLIAIPPRASTLYTTVLLACAVQASAAIFQVQALGRGVAVLQTQRAPAVFWKEWLRQWLLSVTRFWGLLCIGPALLLAGPSSHIPWLIAPALLSLVLCLGVPSGLARAGLLPRRLGTAIECGMVALAVYVGLLGIPAVLAWFAALPAMALALCALGWPAMAYWLMAAKSGAARTAHGRQTQIWRRVGDACGRWIDRFQPVNGDIMQKPPGRRTMLMLIVAQNLMFFGQLFPVHWGQHATSARIAQLAVVCALCCGALLVRDLHWRSLLLPRGPQLRRLGSRIVLSTMLFQAPLALLFALGELVASAPASLGWHSTANFTVPLLEVACCTSLMTVLRALSQRAQKAAAILLFLAWAYAYIPKWFKLSVPEIGWRIGPVYVLVLACVTGAALLLANRLWTPQRLLNALRMG
jgi:hypothetical protein